MPKGTKPRPLEERFWEKVHFEPNSGCWLWGGYTNGVGYGLINVRRRTEGYRKNIYAHRFSWEIHRGSITDGLFVCHQCDVPACCNPEHLWLGTNAENMADSSLKGRQKGIPGRSMPGEKNYWAKLTADAVREIRSSSMSGTDLARKFGVSESGISSVRCGRSWRHVDD